MKETSDTMECVIDFAEEGEYDDVIIDDCVSLPVEDDDGEDIREIIAKRETFILESAYYARFDGIIAIFASFIPKYLYPHSLTGLQHRCRNMAFLKNKINDYFGLSKAEYIRQMQGEEDPTDIYFYEFKTDTNEITKDIKQYETDILHDLYKNVQRCSYERRKHGFMMWWDSWSV